MNKLQLDAGTLEKLLGAGTGTELCDQSGQTRGFFLTPEQYQRFLYSWARTQFSDEKSESALQSVRANGGKSTSEVLALLQGLK